MPIALAHLSREQAHIGGKKKPQLVSEYAMSSVTVSHPPIVDLTNFEERRDDIVRELMKAATETGASAPSGSIILPVFPCSTVVNN